MQEELAIMASPITIKGNGYQVSIAPEAEKLRDTLIRESQNTISEVNSQSSSALAHEHLRSLSSFRVSVRKTRELITKPLTDKQKEIIRMVETFLESLEKEENRVKTLQGAWVEKQAIEQTRLRMEAIEAKLAAERAAYVAEELRLQQKDATEAADQLTDDPMAQAKAAMEASKREREAQDKEQEEARLRSEAAMKELECEEAKVKGCKMIIDFTVESPEKLYAHLPRLCILDVKRRETLEELNRQSRDGEEVGLPGIHVFKRPNIISR